jgi:hypothetical protein
MHYEKVLNDSSILFPYLIILLFTFAFLTYYETIQEKFIIVIFSFIVLIIYDSKVKSGLIKEHNIQTTFKENQDNIKDIELVLPNVYSVHNKPKEFLYIIKHNEILELINQLSFIKRFDNATFEIIIILIENFLKNYYKCLDDTYDDKLYFDILKDMRHELLDKLYGLFVYIPEWSKISETNIHELFHKIIRKLQSFTYKRLKIISRKCKLDCNVDLEYEPPYPTSTYNSHFTLF